MRILLVDDHSLMLTGMRSRLELEDDMEIVGEARNVPEAMRLVAELRPDVVVLDLSFNGKEAGIEACREMKSQPDSPLVLIHSAHDSGKDLAGAATARADGYLYKSAESMDLPEAIRSVYAGERPWAVGVEKEKEEDPRPDSTVDTSELTPREREVYVLVSKRHSNAAIAKKLYTSVYTVKNQVSSILRKANVDSRKKLHRSD